MSNSDSDTEFESNSSNNNSLEENESKKKLKSIENSKEDEKILKQINKNVGNFVNNKNDDEPLYWVLPDKLGFPKWISNTFGKEFTLPKKTEKIVKGKFNPLKYQRFLKKFMNPSSPYRGILLYHSLGSGKTCTAIGIAEQFKNKNIVVLLPASLKANFIKKGILFCGDPSYKSDVKNYKEKYTFISYNAPNTPEQIKRIGSLDNKVIIIEEAHNLISRMVGGILENNKNGKFIYDTLMNAKNVRIIALTGTPIQKDQYELALLLNVLRGKIEITQFGITGGNYTINDITSFKKEISDLSFIDYIDINIKGLNIEIHITKKSWNPEYQSIINQIKNIASKHDIKLSYLNTDELLLFPEDPEDFDNFYITSDRNGEKLRQPSVFEKRIMGLISYYSITKEGFPDAKNNEIFRVPMSPYQLQYYQILREKEKKGEVGGFQKSKRKKGSKAKSTFRVYTRQASNFVFPKSIERPFKDKKFKVFKKNINSKKLNKDLIIENDIDEGNIEIDKDYQQRQAKAIAQLVSNGNKYLVPGPEGLNKLSPKMLMILENMKKSPGLIFIYSNFRSMEGVGIFSKVLEFNGYAPYGSNSDKPKYAIYSGTESEDYRNEIINIFSSPSNSTGKRIKVLMTTPAGAEGLDLKNIRQVHVMDPYWYESRIEQVIGRAVRRDSHADLPKKDRNVEIFRYLTVFPSKKGRMSDKMSTEEYIDYNSKKKQKIIDEMLEIMKSASFDCKLNEPQIQGDYKCLDFGNSNEIAYSPKYGKDNPIQVKEKKIEYIPAKINIKTKEIYITDLKNRIIYKFSNKTSTLR